MEWCFFLHLDTSHRAAKASKKSQCLNALCRIWPVIWPVSGFRIVKRMLSQKNCVFKHLQNVTLCEPVFFGTSTTHFFQIILWRQMEAGLKGWLKNHCQHVYSIQVEDGSKRQERGAVEIYRVYNMTLCAIEASYHLNPSKMTCRFCKGVTPMMCSVLCIWITRIIYTPPQLQPRCRPPCLPLLSQASSWALDLARPSQHSVSHLSDRCLPPKQWVIIELHLSGCTHLVWSAAFLLLFLVMAWHPQSA